jgi:hypothetical protein
MLIPLSALKNLSYLLSEALSRPQGDIHFSGCDETPGYGFGL